MIFFLIYFSKSLDKAQITCTFFRPILLLVNKYYNFIINHNFSILLVVKIINN